VLTLFLKRIVSKVCNTGQPSIEAAPAGAAIELRMTWLRLIEVELMGDMNEALGCSSASYQVTIGGVELGLTLMAYLGYT
jgi:hypothetical protein